MKLKRGFNLLLLVGYLSLATDQQPLPLDTVPDGGVKKGKASQERRNHAQEIK